MGSGSVLPSASCQAGQVCPHLSEGMSKAQVKKEKKSTSGGLFGGLWGSQR